MRYKHPESFIYNKNETFIFAICFCKMQECLLALNSSLALSPSQASGRHLCPGGSAGYKPYNSQEAAPSSSAALRSLARLAGTHIFNSSPSTAAQIWAELHQSSRARSRTSIPCGPRALSGRNVSCKVGFSELRNHNSSRAPA